MFTLPLSSPNATLENAGGKGSSLSRLCRLGLNVPPGFILSTDTYRHFVQANGLASGIDESLKNIKSSEAWEQASARIRAAFSAGRIPEEIRREVLEEYHAIRPWTIPKERGKVDEGPSSLVHRPSSANAVAVRSSATAEDLPELSFAGQQDTFLNVSDEEQLLKAIVDCWSSLWTGRAIGYRERNAIRHEDVALAVIVQQMVPSETSGVLFTANPLTGLRSESVIDAAFGLGEALVAGQVEPDHYVVDSFSGDIKSLSLGAKATATLGKPSGRVETVAEQHAGQQTLNQEQVRQLVAAGQQIQQEYRSPQDIEWAFQGGRLYILQSRPITSLFPIPRLSFDPLIVWGFFGTVQGLVGPMTPLGQEAIQRVVLGMGKRLGVKLKFEQQDVFVVAGERLWSRISDVLRNPIGYRIVGAFLEYVEPSLMQILRTLAADPRLGAGKGRLKLSTLSRLLRFFLPIAARMPGNMLFPARGRARFDAMLEAYLQTIRIDPGADRFERLSNFAAFMDAQGGLAEALPILLPRFIPVFGPAMAALNLIEHLQPKTKTGGTGFSPAVLEITRGLPRNVTTEMDLALWEAARAILSDTASEGAFRSREAGELARDYLNGRLSPAAQSAVKLFMDRYGMRGIGEIDLGQPRWREDPTPVMHSLQGYLQIQPEMAPDLLFEKGAKAAEAAVERLAAEVHRQRGGWIKAKLVRAAAQRVRLLMGARESPKFLAVRAMGRVRNILLGIGEEFAASGTIERADDLFFLHVNELQAMAEKGERDWKTLIAGRRQAYSRELRRRQVPRLLVSDGRAFYEGIGADTDTGELITGSPVSPGVVEGRVHVVLDPRTVHLERGEILVCPGTDPAWTPLFMAAGGLVMEVGGMMTHGSVVAREYGIPAVVGVHQATLRLKDGQRIRLDGTSGKIAILANDRDQTMDDRQLTMENGRCP